MDSDTAPPADPDAAASSAFTYTNSKGRTYVLHCRETMAGSGKKVNFYYFGKNQKSEAVSQLPEGYEVVESGNMPFLRKLTASVLAVVPPSSQA